MLTELQEKYQCHTIDLDPWHDQPVFKRKLWLKKELMSVYKSFYQENERVVFTLTRGDIYEDEHTPAGLLVTDLHKQLNEIDISNYFVILLTTDSTVLEACDWLQKNISKDPVPITCQLLSTETNKKNILQPMSKDYNYNSVVPTEISLEELNERQKELLTRSKTFCMYPWIHLHAFPTGQAYPCCRADMKYPLGNCREQTLEEIWNDVPMRKVRQQMLSNQPVEACERCYEQEAAGFFSGRQSANKHHGHLIDRVSETKPDGTLDRFEMSYWDIRFSNLCNLSCRSCGHIFSSSWYQDQAKLAGKEWADRNTVLNYAGRTKTDMWEQLIPHLDYVEQIYFAGGEPLMVEEHYNILDELERRGRFDVRLIYNTNFTQTKLKDRIVFDYWKKFKSVAVGASLDAMGPRAEYIRKGTDWDSVERNRELMLEVCPDVDFYISPTLSIMNALHLPDFHRDWVNKGLIKAQDLNINILQDPPYYRIDIAPQDYKLKIKTKFEEHLEWLKPLDRLRRASVGFESAINFMMATDNQSLIGQFWDRTTQLDNIRRENIIECIPEMAHLR